MGRLPRKASHFCPLYNYLASLGIGTSSAMPATKEATVLTPRATPPRSNKQGVSTPRSTQQGASTPLSKGNHGTPSAPAPSLERKAASFAKSPKKFLNSLERGGDGGASPAADGGMQFSEWLDRVQNEKPTERRRLRRQATEAPLPPASTDAEVPLRSTERPVC